MKVDDNKNKNKKYCTNDLSQIVTGEIFLLSWLINLSLTFIIPCF